MRHHDPPNWLSGNTMWDNDTKHGHLKNRAGQYSSLSADTFAMVLITVVLILPVPLRQLAGVGSELFAYYLH
jgi:hypothetical protein